MKFSALSIAFLFCLVANCHAATGKKTLKGISKVLVLAVVEREDEARHLGIKAETIKTIVELRLRKAGIKVIEEKPTTTEDTLGYGYLMVYVNIVPVNGVPASAVSITMQFRQPAKLLANLDIDMSCTWFDGRTLAAGNKVVREEVKCTGEEHADLFANDYLAMNPKRVSKTE